MEQNSQDDPEQKVANLAAELCSMKAIEAQSERKALDLVNSEKQAQLLAAKYQSESHDLLRQI